MNNKCRARVFNIVQDKYHPYSFTPDGKLKEGAQPLLTEMQIKKVLSRYKSIKRYSFIFHDTDPYSVDDCHKAWKRRAKEYREKISKGELDEEERKLALERADRLEKASQGKYVFSKREKREMKNLHLPLPGEIKNGHWHIVIECESAIPLSSVAKWFNVPENMIDIPKGAGAFLDCVQYLTHERSEQQALGKRLYPDERVTANFDFRKELDFREERKIKFGKNLNKKQEYRYRVLYEGLTIRQLIDEDPLAYQEDFEMLDKLRKKYISERAPIPNTRVNFYVCGEGGVGKGLISRALARALFPNIKEDEDIFFEVGAKGAPFEGYDGQPVIIWNDRRAAALLHELHGRGNVFNVFDTHPTRQRQNVKYSSIVLVNDINIVNGVEDYEEFLNGLAGEYTDKYGDFHEAEDKSQSYRRFPFIIPLHEEDFDLLMNKGFFDGTREYLQYEKYEKIRASFPRIAAMCNGHPAAQRKAEAKALEPVAHRYYQCLSRVKQHENQKTDEEILNELSYIGTQENPSVTSIDLSAGDDDFPI